MENTLKRKLGWLIVLAGIFAAIIVFGNQETVLANSALSAPTGLQLTDADTIVITWDRVPENDGYIVEINGAETEALPINVERLDVTLFCSESINYKIRVCAIDADLNRSSFSEYVYVQRANKLPAPNLSIDNGVLFWSAVENATGYTLVINGIKIEDKLTETQYDLTALLASVGEYSIKLCAIGDGKRYVDSPYGNFTYTNTLTLAMPKNLSVAPNDSAVVCSWDRVAYADSYTVEIGNSSFTTTRNLADITQYVSEVKQHLVYVKANGSGGFLDSQKVSATYDTVEKLDTPQLLMNNAAKSVSWSEVPNATTYSVAVNGAPCATELSGTTYDFSNQISGVGRYVITIQANQNGNYQTSDCAVGYYNETLKLSTPIVRISGTQICWDAVENAESYSIFIDGNLKDASITNLQIDILAYCAEVKDYTISVMANSVGYYGSSDRSSVTYSHVSQHNQVVLKVENLTISWQSVLTATSYTVTVDGVAVAENITATTYDLSDVLTQAKWYTVGVFANARGNIFAGTPKTVEILGQQPSTSMKTYRFLGVDNVAELMVYVDGVKTQSTLSQDGTLTLSADAKSVDFVLNADILSYEGVWTYYGTVTLDTASLTDGAYEITVKSISYNVDHLTGAGEEGLNGVSYFVVDGIQYSYHYVGTAIKYPV